MKCCLDLQGGICHNNICQTSIFVAQDGSWKLGCLEYACRFTDATTTNLSKMLKLRYQGSVAPEEKVYNNQITFIHKVASLRSTTCS